jgi:hypothetical protein
MFLFSTLAKGGDGSVYMILANQPGEPSAIVLKKFFMIILKSKTLKCGSNRLIIVRIGINFANVQLTSIDLHTFVERALAKVENSQICLLQYGNSQSNI